MVDAQERFWSFVDASGPCFEWTGGTTRGGYGCFKYQGVTKRAHRVSWEFLVGPIPEGLHLDHLCKNVLCVCPEHLEPVTPKENVLRGSSGARQQARTHCPHGHEYTEENTVRRASSPNKRRCRACERIRKSV